MGDTGERALVAVGPESMTWVPHPFAKRKGGIKYRSDSWMHILSRNEGAG